MGEESDSSARIKSFLEARLETGIWVVKTESIFVFCASCAEKGIEKEFLEVKKASVEKTLPGTLNVFLEKRQGAAILAEGDNFFLLDTEGVAFKEVKEKQGLPVIYDPEQESEISLGETMVSQEKLAKIMEISQGLEDINEASLEKLVILNEKRLNAEMEEGWTVYFDLEEDLSWQITKLKLLLKEEITSERRESLEYVDLRFEKAFYK